MCLSASMVCFRVSVRVSARAGVRGTDGEREGGRVGENGSVGEDLFAHSNE